jgi:outer membrane protein assembly factor BamA
MRKNRVIACRFFYSMMAISLLQTQLFAQDDSVKKKSLLLLPVISRSIETGWSFGAVAALTFRVFPKDTVSRTSNLEAIMLYSTKKQLVTAINGTQFFHHEKYILNEQISFSSFPDKFWGLGKNTPDEAEEPYKFNQYYIYLHLHRKIANGLFVGMIFEKQKVWNIDYIHGGIFDKQNVTGRFGYHVSGLGGSITYDKRNNAFASDRGFYGQLFVNYFDKHLSSDYTYTNIVLDLRKYIHLGRSKVLALQLYNFNTMGSVPLRSLASFGGANRMRGYYEGRYRDLDQMIVQGEYRFNIYKRLGAVAFAGTGSVANSYSDYALADLRYSYGAGLRFALDKKERLNIRLDYGIGQGKNHGFYLQLGEAF